jgi:hypothetical protein
MKKNYAAKRLKIMCPFLLDHNTFGGEGIQKMLCLPDPIDPELIASKVKEILSSKTKEKRLQRDGLESNLKQFLKLD